MPGKIIDGRKLAEEIKISLKEQIEELNRLGKRLPTLAVVLVGNDPASEVYVNHKSRACKQIGIQSELYKFSDVMTEEELQKELEKLNQNNNIDGILLQLPLPPQLDTYRCIAQIAPHKDVDGLTPLNQGNVLLNKSGLYPCTPLGILKILENIHNIRGARVAVVGYGMLVGAPLVSMLVRAGATVIICHRNTKDPEKICAQADVLIVATGQKNLVNKNWVKEGAIVLDVGIHKEDKKLVGDVNFSDVLPLASYISPVPGGVGPMTVAMLLSNCLKAYHEHNKS